jgi:hypothetical protein
MPCDTFLILRSGKCKEGEKLAKDKLKALKKYGQWQEELTLPVQAGLWC